MRKGLAILAVAVLLAVAIFALRRDAPKPVKFAYADGTVVEVLKVTTGLKHRFRYDNRWQDFAAQFLPGKLGAKLKPHILEYTTTNADSLLLWLRQEEPVRIRARPGTRVPEIYVADQAGVEVRSQSNEHIASSVRTGTSNVWFIGCKVESLPRHAQVIMLGFYERDKRLGELKLLNPAYHGESTLRPETLPQVKSAGDVQVKLWSVDSGKSPWGGQRVDWRVSTELTRDGLALPDWRLDKVEVFDEVRQSPGPEAWRSSYDPISQRANFDSLGAWWPQATWRLRVWVTQITNYSAAESWTLSDLPMPGFTETIISNEVRQFGDSRVEWLGFSGPGAMPQTIPGRFLTQFRVPKTDDLRIVFIRGHDDLGRKLSRANGPQSEATSTMPGDITYSFGLDPWYNARTVTLEFAVHRARSVDFVVKPSRSEQSGTAPSRKTP